MKKILLHVLVVSAPFFAAQKGSADVEITDDSPWGYHLILDCKSCDVDTITSKDQLTHFVKVLVKAIGMKAYGEPLLEYFAEHNPDAAGYSLLQFIETSSITGHFVTKNGDCYLDIFSCQSFDPQIAKSVVQDHLKPESMHTLFLQRKAF
jgi:S-adenosylmethionine decarboxylase